MREDIGKKYNHLGVNIQNIQRTYASQHQKTSNPN